MDLRSLNKFINYQKFRMTTLQCVLPLLSPGSWMATLDLQDAYFHITILQRHRQFLRFTVGNQHYQYMVLPFGLLSAPRVFTKMIASMGAYLRLQGVTLFQYIDNWLLVASSPSLLHLHLSITVNLLEFRSIAVNHKKSYLHPVQRLQYIGPVLESVSVKAFLPDDRAASIIAFVMLLQRDPCTDALNIQRLLGHMAASISVIPLARL